MDPSGGSASASASWPHEEGWEATEPSPGILVAAMEEAPTLTVAATVGVTLVVICAIAIVFVLGVLIDCRQQRRLEQQKEKQKRARKPRRVSAHPRGDATSIVDNMEEPDLSEPPAVVILRDMP